MHKNTNTINVPNTQKVDSFAYFVGVFGNVATVPQALKAWKSDSPGMSISTWAMYSGISIVWLVYAIKHNAKPLILAQIVGMTCNLVVVTGWMYNKYI